MIKILIGIPIHESRDYAIKRWLANVAKLREVSSANLLLVDSSLGVEYMKKVEGYLAKYGVTDYQLKHIEIPEFQSGDERMGRSREIIRQEILSGDYDAWFSWECDQITPPDALGRLVRIMKDGNYMMVSHNPLTKKVLAEPNNNFGCTLIRKDALKKYGFLLEYPDMPDCWHGGEAWFKTRLLEDGGRYIEINIYNSDHSNKYRDLQNLKLNLGCGRKLLKGYVNIDIQEPCDLRHDLRIPVPFDNNSVDEIYTEGSFVCLFSYKEWGELKKEMARVLKPGGKLEIECVDLEYVLPAFLNNTEGRRWSWWIKTIFASEDDEYDFCKNGFTYDKLMSDLSEEGMINFSREPSARIDIHLVCYKQKQP